MFLPQMQPVQMHDLTVFSEADGSHVASITVGIHLEPNEPMNATNIVMMKLRIYVERDQDTLRRILEKTHLDAVATLRRATELLAKTDPLALLDRLSTE